MYPDVGVEILILDIAGATAGIGAGAGALGGAEAGFTEAGGTSSS